jgi:DNA polymerase-1
MRSTAKTVNFGIVYGISAYGLSRDLRISVGEAQKFIDSYFERYTGVSGYIENTIEKARADGYVKTLLGRRRYIPELNSSNDHIRKFAERAAVNTTVQGSAADLIKLAMIACHEAFRRTRVDMIIQVHDELVFEVPEKQLSGAAARIKEIMETVRPLEVPLTVDMEAGPDWYDMSPVGEQSGTVRR